MIAESDAEPKQMVDHSQPQDHVNVRVLLVEDSPTSQMAIKQVAKLQFHIDFGFTFFSRFQMITRAGFSCDVAGNGEEALRAMERIVYSIVLMDLQMPVKDGAEATKELRANELKTGEHIPVIGISASGSENERCVCDPISSLVFHWLLSGALKLGWTDLYTSRSKRVHLLT